MSEEIMETVAAPAQTEEKAAPKKYKKVSRKKVCQFCANAEYTVDYKDYDRVKRFVSEKGKILPRRVTGNCAKHQRVVVEAVKRARHIAILPYAAN